MGPEVSPDEVVKIMSWRDFIDAGYLAEVNRRVLHPLGLALSVTADHAGVIDAQHDPEGWMFGPESMPEVTRKAEQVAAEEAERRPAREAALGFFVQPVGSDR